jgi:lipopolysaccharide transport system ATP-binding protein
MRSIRIKLENVGKVYKVYPSIARRVLSWIYKAAEPSSAFEALKDVSITFKEGETVAIIGENGAGKSTIQKVISGVTRCSSGSVVVNGQVKALLELGLGFNPDLSGRENIITSLGMMGHSPIEISAVVNDIISFSELGSFIDDPLRTYSSGMQARLAFSVATSIQPDILIVDEILSVGDAYFQHKSFAKIQEFRERGSTIIFVSHSMGDVRAISDRVILMSQGRIVKDGPPDEVIDYYIAMMAYKEELNSNITQKRDEQGWLKTESGTLHAELTGLELRRGEARANLFSVGDLVELTGKIKINTDIESLVIGALIKDRVGHVVWGSNTWHTGQLRKNLKKGDVLDFALKFSAEFGPGSYGISVALTKTDNYTDGTFHWVDNEIIFEVINQNRSIFVGSNNLKVAFHV